VPDVTITPSENVCDGTHATIDFDGTFAN